MLGAFLYLHFPRVWRVVDGLALQMWDIFLAFGVLWMVWRSKCGIFSPRLEGLVWCIAPNVSNFPRVWSAPTKCFADDL